MDIKELCSHGKVVNLVINKHLYGQRQDHYSIMLQELLLLQLGIIIVLLRISNGLEIRDFKLLMGLHNSGKVECKKIIKVNITLKMLLQPTNGLKMSMMMHLLMLLLFKQAKKIPLQSISTFSNLYKYSPS